jgi:hypothetical protein
MGPALLNQFLCSCRPRQHFAGNGALPLPPMRYLLAQALGDRATIPAATSEHLPRAGSKLGYDEPGDTTSIYRCVLGDAPADA